MSRLGIARIVAFVLWLGAGGVSGQPAEISMAVRPSIATRSDGLMEEGRLEEAYAVLADHLERSPEAYGARWRAIRLALGLAIAAPAHESSLRWIRIADDHGREALDRYPDDLNAVAWAAAARGRRALVESGTRTIAGLARDAWELTDAVLERDPSHPLGNHVRGKIHQEVSRLPGIARFMGRLFLGNELVSRASWEGAETHLRRAVEADPGMVLFHLDLGQTYAMQEKWSEAIDAFRTGLSVPNRYPVDTRFKQEMERRVEELGDRFGG